MITFRDLASTRASFPNSLKYLFALLCHKTLRNYLKQYYGGTYFPIDLLSEISKLKIVSFNEIKSIFARDLTIESYALNHPGGSVAYSIATSTAKLCCLLDNEYGDNQLQSQERIC